MRLSYKQKHASKAPVLLGDTKFDTMVGEREGKRTAEPEFFLQTNREITTTKEGGGKRQGQEGCWFDANLLVMACREAEGDQQHAQPYHIIRVEKKKKWKME